MTQLSKPPRHGLSMVEMLCSLSVTATALGAALPGLDAMREQQALAAVATELETDLQYARSLALARNQNLRLTVRPLNGGSCYVIHTGSANACRCDGSGQVQCSDGEALRLVEHVDPRRPYLSSSTVQSLQYDASRGTLTPTATLKVVDRRGRAIHQVVNIMGRVRSCAPQGDLAGLRKC